MIFKLIREDGLKYKEVAEILNISVNTIDVQMAIAVKKICTALHIKNPSKLPSNLCSVIKKNFKKSPDLVDDFVFAVLNKTRTTAAWKLHIKYGT